LNTHGYHNWILTLLLLTGLLEKGCYKEKFIGPYEEWKNTYLVLAFDQVFAFADLEEHMLLFTLPSDTINTFTPQVLFGDYQSVTFNGLELAENEINDLGEVVVNHPYTVVAQNSTGTNTFQLFFTSLPLLRITTDQQIRDDPKVGSLAEIQYVTKGVGNSKTHTFTTNAGIEIRGRTSALLEKKSYGLELWKDGFGSDRSVPLLGMRNGEDWILDAMYIDPLRMRNKLAFELWEKMWIHTNETPWRTLKPGIQCEFVELFINQRYMGLYCLSEKLDEALINLSEGQPGAEGVMYKAIDWEGGATAFKTYSSEPAASMIWEGWEQVCPNDYFCWEPLAGLRKTVVLDKDEIFTEKIDSLVDLDCMAAYYLFTNMILAYDNIIKNYFLARYPDQSRFLLLPWDLEGSWGIMWDGDLSSSNGLLENNLYNRLLDLDVGEFTDLLESKWENYRGSIFQLDSLMAPAILYADLLKQSGAVERENRRWKAAEIDMDAELLYFLKWTALRLAYLDEVFDGTSFPDGVGSEF
jgi:spore coat protein H